MALEQVGHFGGCTRAVEVVGNYVYIGQGQDFLILDISKQASPILLGKIMTKGFTYGIKVFGNYAYVASSNYEYVLDNHYLSIVDMSNPSSPVLKGSYNTNVKII